ncbi:TetR/AcrR family transcriptional regulator [Desulfitobacterium chlororespirans]|uniref:Transcriptional regulator, TetR family n=1 Tax=Desulfitobacterium chlororespirans DSM 11544 TaxID=1121395 RepID=A0A1M7SJE7_9FIRM|nr:TetR/AcrR family transcriptional regulator [Desulfitobacterium chlororespirans]SHN58583.1 transcriptional regulator, TetR family [Desulfitobacterium chlororespirans DSM 11544]
MTTYDMIKESLKSLLKTTPLKNISVEDICRNAYVSRKTFYTYFTNKFDLIDKMFQDDVIASMNELRELLPRSNFDSSAVIILERFYQSFYSEKDFYTCIVRGKGQYWFRDRLVMHITNVNKEITQRYAKILPPVEIEYMSYFFAASQAMLLYKWLQEGCERLTPRQMAEYYIKWAMRNWDFLENDESSEPRLARNETRSGARRASGAQKKGSL